MKSSELYFEQVLIGTLAMVTGGAPWLPELKTCLESLDTASAVAGSSFFLGLAFWIGIPLDRLADSISDRLDRHGRLRFALKRAAGTLLQEGARPDAPYPDLYPEDRLRIASLREGEAVVDWIDYDRSRIRLARSLALYSPALTLALTVGLDRMHHDPAPPLSSGWPVAILGAYFVWAFLNRCPKPLPRTDDPKIVSYARRWGFIETTDQPVKAKPGSTDLAVWASEWQGLVIPAGLLATSLLVALGRGRDVLSVVAAGGVSITILAAWTWWRISYTFRTYLSDLQRYPKASAAR